MTDALILQGVVDALTTGIDARVRQTNVITGLLSIATGILIVVWPAPGLVAVAVVLGAWLIVTRRATASRSTTRPLPCPLAPDRLPRAEQGMLRGRRALGAAPT